MPSLPSKPSRLALARAGIAAVFAAIALLCLGQWIGPERSWILANAQYLPYYAFLLPALAALAASRALGWGWRALAAGAVALVVTQLMGLELNRAQRAEGRLRVMTYNIKDYATLWRPRGFERLAEEVARHRPDVLVLQDAALLSADDLRPRASRALFDGMQTYARGEYVIASRYPMRGCTEGGRPDVENAYGYVRCTVAAPGGELDVLTTHLLSPRPGFNALRRERLEGIEDWRNNVRRRLAEAGELSRVVGRRDRPLVVAGDLNAPESSLVVRRLLDTGLRDAFSLAGRGFGFTYGHSALDLGIPFLRIDHILVSPELAVLDCFPGGQEGSPHRPVIADLRVAGARPGG